MIPPVEIIFERNLALNNLSSFLDCGVQLNYSNYNNATGTTYSELILYIPSKSQEYFPQGDTEESQELLSIFFHKFSSFTMDYTKKAPGHSVLIVQINLGPLKQDTPANYVYTPYVPLIVSKGI